MKPNKTEVRLARCGEVLAEVLAETFRSGTNQTFRSGMALEPRFLTRRQLAALLQVSVRTVDEMVAAKEITPVRIRGLVRFYLPGVLRDVLAETFRSGTGEGLDASATTEGDRV